MAGGPRLPAWAISGAANHAPLPSRARRHGLRGHGPSYPSPRPESHVGVPEALLPRREPGDGRVPAAAVEKPLPRGLRRGGRRPAPVRGRATGSSATPSARCEITGGATTGSTCATSRSATCARSSSRSCACIPTTTAAASAPSCWISSSIWRACGAAPTWCSRWPRTTRTRCAGTASATSTSSTPRSSWRARSRPSASCSRPVSQRRSRPHAARRDRRAGQRRRRGAEGGGTTGPISPSGASSRSTMTGA